MCDISGLGRDIYSAEGPAVMGSWSACRKWITVKTLGLKDNADILIYIVCLFFLIAVIAERLLESPSGFISVTATLSLSTTSRSLNGLYWILNSREYP